MTDPTRRAIRTFLQAFVGTLIASGVLQGVAESGDLPSGDAVQRVLVSAAAAGIIALLSWAQNTLEDRTGTAFLK